MSAVRPGAIVLIGSGETAAVGRAAVQWLRASGREPRAAAVLETPAGFEPNSQAVAARWTHALHGELPACAFALDARGGHATMRLDASDRAVGGSVRAELRIQLVEAENGTEVRLVTEATLAGRIGDLGQPLIKRQADRIAAEFARCVERTLGAGA